MLASAIFELASSQDGALIAAALFEKTVQVWNVTSKSKVCELATIFCGGANNLAVDKTVLVAGLSNPKGRVIAYEVPSGNKLWERSLTYPSSLRFDSCGEHILCTTNHRSVVRLEASTGATIEVFEKTEKYVEDSDGRTLKYPTLKGKPVLVSTKDSSFDIGCLGFGLLDAKFLPDSVCMSEANGPVRCISCVTGRLEWTFDPGVRSHVLRLHYSPRLGALWGVLANFMEKRLGSRQLVQFDITGGSCTPICDLRSWADVFSDQADQLVTSEGAIRDLANGNLIGQLAFPMRDYLVDPWK